MLLLLLLLLVLLLLLLLLLLWWLWFWGRGWGLVIWVRKITNTSSSVIWGRLSLQDSNRWQDMLLFVLFSRRGKLCKAVVWCGICSDAQVSYKMITVWKFCVIWLLKGIGVKPLMRYIFTNKNMQICIHKSCGDCCFTQVEAGMLLPFVTTTEQRHITWVLSSTNTVFWYILGPSKGC